MADMNTSRIMKIGDALSQLINVMFLPNHRYTTPNESISGRAWRRQKKTAIKIIDFIFSKIEKDHCKLSYEADIKRAKEYLVLSEEIEKNGGVPKPSSHW